MEFNPNNNIVKRCLQGMSAEDNNNIAQARGLFMQAWNEASSDLEKFIAAWYVARQQEAIPGKLTWLNNALELAIKINNDTVNSALPALYTNMAKNYEALHDHDNAKKSYELAASCQHKPFDKGPFYHGTRANLQVSDLLTAGGHSNYKTNLQMNHIYFTGSLNGAGLAAALARSEERERVYIIEPTGNFENDPNVTNKKFPGNPTRSYRSESPLKIIGEVKDWIKITAEELRKWREKLDNNKGEIIN